MEFPVDARVIALYPQTTTFYPANVMNNPSGVSGAACVMLVGVLILLLVVAVWDTKLRASLRRRSPRSLRQLALRNPMSGTHLGNTAVVRLSIM